MITGFILEQPELPYEPHPGIRSWMPPRSIPHAPIPLSKQPQNVQGVPRRRFSRMGVRAAYSILSSAPPGFAFLLENVRQTPQGPVAAQALVPQLQAPIGIYH